MKVLTPKEKRIMKSYKKKTVSKRLYVSDLSKSDAQYKAKALRDNGYKAYYRKGKVGYNVYIR